MEIAQFMSSNMVSVFSGGILQEYVGDGFGDYGLVSITGAEVSELSRFTAFSAALSSYGAPTGDGGFMPTQNSAAYPTQNSYWSLGSLGPTSLPSSPEQHELVSNFSVTRALGRPKKASHIKYKYQNTIQS